jgi:hypothetical protein
MNASVEVSRLLEESGAVLVRHKKHLVYQLPNGRTFTRYKSPSDHRAPLNELSDLRRALACDRPAVSAPTQEPPAHGPLNCAKEHNEMPVPQKAIQPATANLVEAPKQLSLKERLDAAIRDGEVIQEKLMAEAQAAERRVGMLKALLQYAEEPSAEEALRAILPAPRAPTVAQSPRMEPPQQIVDRVQVTRELVFAATQTFGENFTVNDVMDLMTGGRQIEGKERLRVRQSIAAAMVSLHERGELLKAQEHLGRSQTVWQRAQLRVAAVNSNGEGQATGAQA